MASKHTQATLDAAEYGRTQTCPKCGGHNITRSNTCLADILQQHTQLSIEHPQRFETSHSGKFCDDDGCYWFKLDRAPDDNTSTNSQSRKKNLVLRDGTRISKYNTNVSLRGNKAIYRAEAGCDNCGGDVRVKLKRFTSEKEDGTVETEQYRVIAEECYNYGQTGDACDYQHIPSDCR